MAIVQHSKDAKLISVISKQISKEYAEISGLLIEYMTLNKLSGLRLSEVNEVLLKVAEAIPGYDRFHSMIGNPKDVLYKMFRETLVARSYDIDPAGSGDVSRDEHILFNMVGIPELKAIYDIVYPRYKIKSQQEFYNEQAPLLYEMLDDVTGKTEERKIEVVQAIKAQGVSVARSKPLPEVEVKIERDNRSIGQSTANAPGPNTPAPVLVAESAEISTPPNPVSLSATTVPEQKEKVENNIASPAVEVSFKSSTPVKEAVGTPVVSTSVSKQPSNNGTPNTTVTNSVVSKSVKKPI